MLPGKSWCSGAFLIFRITRRVSKIDIGSKEANEKPFPIRFFQTNQRLATKLRAVLFEFQFPAYTVFLSTRTLLRQEFQTLVIHAQESLALGASEINGFPGGLAFMQ